MTENDPDHHATDQEAETRVPMDLVSITDNRPAPNKAVTLATRTTGLTLIGTGLTLAGAEILDKASKLIDNIAGNEADFPTRGFSGLIIGAIGNAFIGVARERRRQTENRGKTIFISDQSENPPDPQ